MISIIVPIYNAEKTLDRCLESLVSQTYKDIQIILVNDGSIDHSLDVCVAWKKKESRILLINKKNEGLPYARKTGLEHVTGEYVLFVDADDWIEPEMVNRLHYLMIENRADIAICKLVMDFPNGAKKYISNIKQVICLSPEKTIEKINYNEIEASLCNKMFRASLMTELDFKKEVTIGEDYRITWQLIRNATNVVCTPEVFYHYIQQADSMVHQGYKNNGLTIIENYTQIKNSIIKTYPQQENSAISYWYLQEMAIVISMIRGKQYDRNVIKLIKEDIRMYLKKYLSNKHVPIYLKVCAILLSLHEQLLIKPYQCFFFWRDRV